ncbi:unnamed protein product [Mytilus edulis]|uniref:Uncharacterized protein n=1 Tax=Mytilus edulis TaxID=6550 RepID=A0A8S3TID9_MYTED|nr:unnamed protein product [Mytilus edulis]
MTLIKGEPDWIVNERVSGYGEHLTLFCLIDDCCTQEAGWVKYDPDYETIYLDVRNSKYYTSTEKYAATTNNEETRSESELPITGIIIGSLMGFVIILIAAVVFLLKLKKNRRRKKRCICGDNCSSDTISNTSNAEADIIKTFADSSQNDHGVCVNIEKENKEKKLAHQTTNITDAFEKQETNKTIKIVGNCEFYKLPDEQYMPVEPEDVCLDYYD